MNMINPRFGLQYTFPHSLVHIVDNSEFRGRLPRITADNPSLYSTLVVTATPMGQDNFVTDIDRADILVGAYGLGANTGTNMKRFGQTVNYPMALLEQNAPVRLLRVTPEGSTFAVSTIVCQWRRDETGVDPKITVRFKALDLPPGIRLDRYKNPERLNAQLVAQLESDNVPATDGGLPWKQRVLFNNISAGRGSAYNRMACTVNPIPQGRRPANVGYSFATIDTITNRVVERFVASLNNNDNQDRVDALPTVNAAIAQRVPGSSIVIPFLNERTAAEVYADYVELYRENMDAGITSEVIQNNFRMMNLNNFDLIYGRQIWNGNEGTIRMPFYVVDKEDVDIPRLPDGQVMAVTENTLFDDGFNERFPKDLLREIEKEMFGITRPADINSNTAARPDHMYVGDLYMEPGNARTRPSISIVTAINQYSGAVTDVNIPQLFPLHTANEPSTGRINKNMGSFQIELMFSDGVGGDPLNSRTLRSAITQHRVNNGSIVAYRDTDLNFKLFTVHGVVRNDNGIAQYSLREYTQAEVYQALDWDSVTSPNVGNVIGLDESDPAWNRVGATVLRSDGRIYVNGFKFRPNQTDEWAWPNRFLVLPSTTTANRPNALKIGRIPKSVNLAQNYIGTEFDVMVYRDDAADDATFILRRWEIENAGTGYRENDVLTIDGFTTRFRVHRTNANGGIVELRAINPGTREEESFLDTGTDGLFVDTNQSLTYFNPDTANPLNNPGTGAVINIRSNWQEIIFPGTPNRIIRYTVSSVTGSIFRITINPISIQANYYTADHGISMHSNSLTSKLRLQHGSTGFFDEEGIHPIVFKLKYAELLVKAYRGLIDPRIMSPSRVKAKFLFDGGHNTIFGNVLQPHLNLPLEDLIASSTIFTEEEKEAVIFRPEILDPLRLQEIGDIDVKQAMYDLMIERVYDGLPEDGRPVDGALPRGLADRAPVKFGRAPSNMIIGPGSGMSLHLDAGITDAKTMLLVDRSFARRFDNPNASWDIGGIYSAVNGEPVTYCQRLAHNLLRHCMRETINKPYAFTFSTIPKNEYVSYFPDIDTTDWELRQLHYESGGNVWIADANGNLERQSQRTLIKHRETSDLVQESNMRTLTRLIFLLQQMINRYLMSYSDDGVLQTMREEAKNMFASWIGELVDDLDIDFERGINIDGGEIVMCYVEVIFRGLILRVPIIVNVNRRDNL
jgi:hypothetical protein